MEKKILENLYKRSKNIRISDKTLVWNTEIIEALDGPITLTSCVDKSESFCEASDICFLGGKWNKINEIIRKSLNDISLKDLLSYENPFLIDDNKDVLFDRTN